VAAGFALGIIPLLTVAIGCVVANVGFSMLAIAGISSAVALIVGDIASVFTYAILKHSGKINEPNVSEPISTQRLLTTNSGQLFA
jgi:hypothetical protein